MKNVIINKLVKYVFTEGQLKAKWERLGETLDYETLTSTQQMILAKKMLDEASHHELEQNMIGYGWRTEYDITGKMIDDDDTHPSMHIELIDTSKTPEHPNHVIIDRLVTFKCEQCDFQFYIEESIDDPGQLKCPKDGGAVHIINDTIHQVHKK